MKSKLKVYFPIFLFKRRMLIAHLNKLIFRKGNHSHCCPFLQPFTLLLAVALFLCKSKKAHPCISMKLCIKNYSEHNKMLLRYSYQYLKVQIECKQYFFVLLFLFFIKKCPPIFKYILRNRCCGLNFMR